jgi:hypothetical protein
MAMELKNWLKSNIGRVQISDELGGVTKNIYDTIVNKSDEERLKTARFMTSIIQISLNKVLSHLSEKEGKKGDQGTQEVLRASYGREAVLLTFRILDELILREYR